ncbi:hypothetical protein CPLU01_12802 [Colletotrichum plurivorum]|uniref:Uncharacterized protein n=1 Tax=Colletotrichum plurivorum TaxID=2175906 RepID=A0A8H6JWW7_9PEZI|nr:hypothetical protein CPLU01_12802 [Colletotrichum plurivorum]
MSAAPEVLLTSSDSKVPPSCVQRKKFERSRAFWRDFQKWRVIQWQLKLLHLPDGKHCVLPGAGAPRQEPSAAWQQQLWRFRRHDTAH